MDGQSACGVTGEQIPVYSSEPPCGVGVVPRGCQIRMPLIQSIAASGTGTYEIKPEQANLRLVKLVDEGSGSNVSLTDIQGMGRSLGAKFKVNGNYYTGDLFAAPLSSALSRDNYRNKVQPLPPTPVVGPEKGITFVAANANSGAAENLQLGMYFRLATRREMTTPIAP